MQDKTRFSRWRYGRCCPTHLCRASPDGVQPALERHHVLAGDDIEGKLHGETTVAADTDGIRRGYGLGGGEYRLASLPGVT